MNTLLICRAELVCVIILLCLLFYSAIYLTDSNSIIFLKMCIFAFFHVLFDLCTVYTVNHLDSVPYYVNRYCHILFYLSAMLFCFEVLYYTIVQSLSLRCAKKSRLILRIIILIYVVIAPHLQIEYIAGNGTNYSKGIIVYVSFGMSVLAIIVSAILLLVNWKRINIRILRTFLPVTLIMLSSIIIQIFVPELLFTGAAITVVTIGMFITYQNPTEEYRKKAYVDLFTGMKNKNCYMDDILKIKKKSRHTEDYHHTVGLVICDINNLKLINDTYGHAEGDNLIQKAADVLTQNLRSKHNIYRTGGDEFVAIYIDVLPELIEKEINAVQSICTKISENQSYDLSIAMGYAVTGKTLTSIDEVFQIADANMYQKKIKMKREDTK